MIEDIEDWREEQYQDFQAELGREDKGEEEEVQDSVECEHCKGRIPCSDELGVEEHCPHCGISIFASPEDAIEIRKEVKALIKLEGRVIGELKDIKLTGYPGTMKKVDEVKMENIKGVFYWAKRSDEFGHISDKDSKQVGGGVLCGKYGALLGNNYASRMELICPECLVEYRKREQLTINPLDHEFTK